MKKYTMLKTVSGVREGEIHPVQFHKGESYPLDESLAEQFYHQGAIEEAAKDAKVNPAENRETKVTAPAENKSEEGEAGIPPETQRIEELVALGRDHYGLDVDSTMAREDVLALIEEAKSADGEEDADGVKPRAKAKPAKAKK